MPTQPAISGSRTFVGPSTGGGGGITSRFFVESGSQTVPNNAGDSIDWATVDFNDLGLTGYGGGTVAFVADGIYHIEAFVDIGPHGSTGGWEGDLGIVVNNSFADPSDRVNEVQSGYCPGTYMDLELSVSGTHKFSVGDSVQIAVNIHGSVTDKTVYFATLNITKIA